VWRRKEGGFLVRKKYTDSRTGQRSEVRKVLLDTEDPDTALGKLLDLVKEAREGRGTTPAAQRMPSLIDYALSLFERKCADRSLKSAKTIERWASVIKLHIATAKFAKMYLDQIYKLDIEEERKKWAEAVAEGKYSAHTVNDWLTILRQIFDAAAADYQLERNPMALVADLDTSEHRTHTKEQPNSLTADEVPMFLRALRNRHPQHFAMTALGFATGLRPSHMRPLRRRGVEADLDWDQGLLQVRRSQTRGGKLVGSVVLERTKTAKDQEIGLPDDLMEVLRWHSQQLDNGPQPLRDSELLFPARPRVGRGAQQATFRAPSCLDKPFADVCEYLKQQTLLVAGAQLFLAGVLGLPREAALRGKKPFAKHISAKAMRRTFKDLSRDAKVEKVVEQSISGHVTEQMDARYSTVTPIEQKRALAKVVELAGFRAALLGAAA
jgi:integrase